MRAHSTSYPCSLRVRSRFRKGLALAFVLIALPALQATAEQWAALEADQGLTLVPVLACRTRDALGNVMSGGANNHMVFAKIFVEQGECTRVPKYTSFVPIERGPNTLRIRTTGLGRLWVSQTTRIAGIDDMALAGQLKPEASETKPDHGLTSAEQAAAADRLAERKTVSGYVDRVRIGDGSRRSSGGGRSFGGVRLLNWTQVLGRRNSAHYKSDGKGLNRCARVNVRYDGAGSRLVSAASFIAHFEDGESRRGQKLDGPTIRLKDGSTGAGVICFGGNFMTNIVQVTMR